MLKFIKITGSSLSPEYNAGDFVLIVRLPYGFRVQMGDVIVFRQPGYGTLIKRVERLTPDGQEIFVVGTDPASVDSRTFGVVRLSDVAGKVVWHIRKSG